MKKKKDLKLHKYIIRSVEVLVLFLIIIYLIGFWEQLHLIFKG